MFRDVLECSGMFRHVPCSWFYRRASSVCEVTSINGENSWLGRGARGTAICGIVGAIHSTKISGNFGPKLNGSVRSNRKSFEKTGPPFEVDQFSRSDRLEFWLKGSRPECAAVKDMVFNFQAVYSGIGYINQRVWV